MAPNESTIMVSSSVPHVAMEKVPEYDIEKGSNERKSEFCGLTKEELMKYAEDPFWVRLRWVLFLLFWVVWITMLTGAVIIIIYTDKCQSNFKLKGWNENAFYQVYVPSYRDTNNDGFGDIKGVTAKLPYLKSLGVGTVVLSPPMVSPDASSMSGLGDVHEQLGTKGDMVDLINTARDSGINVVVEVVLSFVSVQHVWFLPSVSVNDQSTDYFVWKGNDSSLDPSHWAYDTPRRLNYRHTYHSSFADLNLQSSRVRSVVVSELEYWLEGENGAAGLAVDMSQFDNDSDAELVMAQVRELCDRYSAGLVVFGGSSSRSLVGGTNTIFASSLLADGSVKNILAEMESLLGSDPVLDTAWQLGSGHLPRRTWTNQSLVLAATLPGTPCIYYGSEISMKDVSSASLTARYWGANYQRSPMLWTDGENAGFSDVSPWIPPVSHTVSDTVAHQRESVHSPWSRMSALLVLRQKLPALSDGDTTRLNVSSEDRQQVYGFIREVSDHPAVVVFVSFSSEETTVNVTELNPGLSTTAELVFTTSRPMLETNSSLSLSQLQLEPAECLVLVVQPDV